jgi:fumarylpyruvate hydrolase
VHRIYCVGRNYAEHAQEMGFTGREPPFFFLKPADAWCRCRGRDRRDRLPEPDGQPAPRDRAGGGHRPGGATSRPPTPPKHIWGYAVGLDMTRRDLQGEMKKQGRPWEHRQGLRPVGADRPDRAGRAHRRADHAARSAEGQRRAAQSGDLSS